MEEQFRFLIPWLITVLRYFIIAGIPFLLMYIFFPKVFSPNKIQSKQAKRKDYRREILHSMQTTLILAGTGFLILKTPLKGFTQTYDRLSEYPLWWVPVSVLLALILHDTYFYWMHRAVHHPKLYKRVHLTAPQIGEPLPVGLLFLSLF